MAKGKRNRYRTQVQAESTLRFNPERSALRSGLRDARGTRSQTIRSQRGAKDSAIATADAVRPRYTSAYSQGTAQIDQALASLGVPVAGDNPLSREVAGAKARMAETLQGALTESQSRKLDAEAGFSFAVRKANEDYAGTVSKIRERLTQLAREQGAFQQARSGELSAADTQRSFTASQNAKARRNARLTAGVDAQGHVVRGGPKDVNGDGQPDSKGKGGGQTTPTGAKLRTPGDHDKLANDIAGAKRAILTIIGTLKRAGKLPADRKAARAMVAKAAAKGTPSISVSQPGDKQGTRVSTKVGGVDPVTNDLALKLGLDVVFDHHVSRAYRELLWSRGYSLKILGLPGPGGSSSSGAKAKGKPGPRSTARGQANDRASVGQASAPRAQTAAHVTVRPHTRRRPRRRKKG